VAAAAVVVVVVAIGPSSLPFFLFLSCPSSFSGSPIRFRRVLVFVVVLPSLPPMCLPPVSSRLSLRQRTTRSFPLPFRRPGKGRPRPFIRRTAAAFAAPFGVLPHLHTIHGEGSLHRQVLRVHIADAKLNGPLRRRRWRRRRTVSTILHTGRG